MFAEYQKSYLVNSGFAECQMLTILPSVFYVLLGKEYLYRVSRVCHVFYVWHSAYVFFTKCPIKNI